MTTVTMKRQPTRTSVPTSTGAIIDEMWAVREAKRKFEAQAEAKGKELSALEEALLARMAAEGLNKAAGKRASASFTETITGKPQGEEGWSTLYLYMAKHKHWSLLQRRVSDPAYRELLASINGIDPHDLTIAACKKQVPGTLPFLVKRLSLTALSS